MAKYLKFEASWCGQCKAQDKLLKDSDLPVEHIDVDDNEELVNLFNIKTMPTMVLVDDSNKELARFNGITPLVTLKEKYNEYQQ